MALQEIADCQGSSIRTTPAVSEIFEGLLIISLLDRRLDHYLGTKFQDRHQNNDGLTTCHENT